MFERDSAVAPEAKKVLYEIDLRGASNLLAATPTCHLLEYVDWASVILEQPLRIENGHAIIPDRIGNGMSWDKKAVEKFRLR